MQFTKSIYTHFNLLTPSLSITNYPKCNLNWEHKPPSTYISLSFFSRFLHHEKIMPFVAMLKIHFLSCTFQSPFLPTCTALTSTKIVQLLELTTNFISMPQNSLLLLISP